MKIKVTKQLPLRLSLAYLDPILKEVGKRWVSWRGKEISVVFVGSKEMVRINRMFRGEGKETDVLSFGYDSDDTLDEIVVSLPLARKQAQMHKLSLSQEIAILLTHGLLHLIGYDHQTEKEKEDMMCCEIQLLKCLKVFKSKASVDGLIKFSVQE